MATIIPFNDRDIEPLNQSPAAPTISKPNKSYVLVLEV